MGALQLRPPPCPLPNPLRLQYPLGVLGEGEGEGGVSSVQAGAWALASVRLAFELRLDPDFRIYTNKRNEKCWQH